MFSGIIQSIGKIVALDDRNGDIRLSIESGSIDLTDMKIGESIAVNGTCLTVVECNQTGFSADVSRETINCTAFAKYQNGTAVNLERSLQLGDRLHGHLVSGHVDGVATVISVKPDARSTRFDFGYPHSLGKYIVKKGSICIDGVSLTVNHRDEKIFSVNIIPHTLSATVFQYYQVGTVVNIEIDQVARYLESLLPAE